MYQDTINVSNNHLQKEHLMPIVTITMRKTDLKTKKELIEKLTATAALITTIPDHHFVFSINELDDENLGIGGKTIQEIMHSS
jgi:4-oxalocrotonate tautomerase